MQCNFSEKSLISLLKKHFGYKSFRPGQLQVIESVLSGNDTLAVMPTGGGKSLCCQLPALVFKGIQHRMRLPYRRLDFPAQILCTYLLLYIEHKLHRQIHHPLYITIVIAAVKVVLPWSTWPMVPMFTCGLLLSNFALAILFSSNKFFIFLFILYYKPSRV